MRPMPTPGGNSSPCTLRSFIATPAAIGSRTPTPPAAYAPGSSRKLPNPKELAAKTAPADALKREDIPAELLA